MATITVTVPDALIPRLTAAMRGQFPQYAALADGAAFKRVTADYWRGVLATSEGNTAVDVQKPAFYNAYGAASAQALADAAGIG